MRACIASDTGYLDITAEINVYRLAEQLGAGAHVMLLPGVGWDVVPTDCLAMHVARRVQQPQSLKIALQVPGAMSRGSAMSVGEAFPEGDLSLLPDGPTPVQRDAHRARAVAEVTGADGSVARSVIETVNGYSYTPLAAVEAAHRVLSGVRRAGFQTPAKLFGVDFAQTIAGTQIIDY